MDMLLKFELIQYTMNSEILKAGVWRHDVLAQLGLTNSKQCTFQLKSHDTTHYLPQDLELLVSQDFPLGVVAHSDGDVVYHSTTDAILGRQTLAVV